CYFPPLPVIEIRFCVPVCPPRPGGPEGDHGSSQTVALLERDRVIEALKQKLQTKEKEVDNLFQRNSHLVREVWYLTDVVQHLNQKLAELEADKQELREKIRSLLNRRPALAQVEQEATSEVENVYNKLLELQGNIRVFCRCRKSSASSCLEKTDDQEVVVVQKGSRKKFQFDKVYSPSSTQEDVFAGTLPVITSCVDGYNVCILAYGQTGSGKTYTMMGSKENPGVGMGTVVTRLKSNAHFGALFFLRCHTLWILRRASLDIRVLGKSVSVPGLTRVEVRTEADILTVMEMGEKNWKIASTKMNIQSSRSHLVVALEVEGSDEVSGLTSRGMLTLCDLAGSERISKTEAEGQRLVEAAAINKSLTALGQVFSALKCNAIHCCMFVNVSPDAKDAVETLSTLQFGSTIRQVALGKATQNVAPAKNRNTK
uniref:Kinesin-like protein n=1 Tax=Oreochromis aureus TaxID=47969 RepID=A0A668UYQ8_OREAU